MNKTYTSYASQARKSYRDAEQTKHVEYTIVTTVKIALVNISLLAGGLAVVYYIINNLL